MDVPFQTVPSRKGFFFFFVKRCFSSWLVVRQHKKKILLKKRLRQLENMNTIKFLLWIFYCMFIQVLRWLCNTLCNSIATVMEKLWKKNHGEWNKKQSQSTLKMMINYIGIICHNKQNSSNI